jgi:hypothetical protein
MLDPVRFKRILIKILKLLIIIELISAFMEGLSRANGAVWDRPRSGRDPVSPGNALQRWSVIKGTCPAKGGNGRTESPDTGCAGLSLLWSDEIMLDIPDDRRRLVISAFTLIAAGLVLAFIEIGTGLMPLVILGSREGSAA